MIFARYGAREALFYLGGLEIGSMDRMAYATESKWPKGVGSLGLYASIISKYFVILLPLEMDFLLLTSLSGSSSMRVDRVSMSTGT